jgi:hypothetical protein
MSSDEVVRSMNAFNAHVSRLSEDTAEIANCLQRWRLLLDLYNFRATEWESAFKENVVSASEIKAMLKVAARTCMEMVKKFTGKGPAAHGRRARPRLPLPLPLQ